MAPRSEKKIAKGETNLVSEKHPRRVGQGERSLYQNLLDGISEIVYSVKMRNLTLAGEVEYVSGQTEKILGFRPAEFTQNRGLWSKTIHPDDLPAVIESTKRMVTTKKKILRLYRMKHKLTGEYRWMEDAVTPMVDAQGRLIGLLGAARDVTERKLAEQASKRSEELLHDKALQQTFIGQLSQQALAGIDLDSLMSNAVSGIVKILNVEYSKVLELQPDTNALLLRAGEGWKEGHVGRATVGIETNSQAGYTLQSREPVFVRDLRTETRFTGPPLLLDHGVVSGVSVIIGGVDRPRGILGAHTTSLRIFTEEDIQFLQAIANVLAMTIDRKKAEEESQKFALAIEKAADCIFIADQNGIIQYMNSAFEKTTGYNREEAIGKTPRILKSGEYDRKFYETMWRQILSGETFHFEFVNKKKGGEEYIDDRTIVPLVNSLGVITHFVSTGRDITERRRVETTLHESEKRYKILVENSTEAIYFYDPQNQRIVEANPAFLTLLGYTAPEATKLSAYDFVAHDRKSIDEIFRRISASGAFKVGERKWRRKDGTLLDVQVTANSIQLGNKEFVFVIGSDITERKEAEESLRKSEKKYREVVEHATEIIFTTNGAGVFTYANPAAVRAVGYSLEELQNLNFRDLILPEYRSRVGRVYYRQVYKKDASSFVEFPFRTKSGEVKWFGQNATTVFVGEELVGFRVIARDITERKRGEESLKNALSLHKATLESTTDGILVVDNQGLIVSFNQKFVDMWHIPESVIASKDDNQALGFVLGQLKNPEGFLKKVNELYAQPTTESYDVLEFNDGRIFERYSQPHRVEGKSVGRVWSFRDITERKRAEASLHQANARLKFLSQRLIDVQEAERRSIASELHDQIGQDLTALKINLESMKGKFDPTLISRRAGESVALVEGILSQTRTLSHELRPSMLDDLGLVAALRWYVNLQAQRANLRSEFAVNFPSDSRFDPSIETVCFRVAQEAVVNVMRHANAKKILVDLILAKDEIHLNVRDDGVGFDVDTMEAKARRGASFGLVGMRERALLVNGRLEIFSDLRKGTEVHAHFPVKLSKHISPAEF